MDTLNFYNKLAGLDIFTDETFNYTGQTLSIDRFKSEWVTFENCIFECKTIEFINILGIKLSLEFKNCTFNCNISFSNCTFERLTFKTQRICAL